MMLPKMRHMMQCAKAVATNEARDSGVRTWGLFGGLRGQNTVGAQNNSPKVESPQSPNPRPLEHATLGTDIHVCNFELWHTLAQKGGYMHRPSLKALNRCRRVRVVGGALTSNSTKRRISHARISCQRPQCRSCCRHRPQCRQPYRRQPRRKRGAAGAPLSLPSWPAPR